MNNIDIFIGGLPTNYSKDELYAVIFNSYYYFQEECAEIDALADVTPKDILKVSPFKKSEYSEKNSQYVIDSDSSSSGSDSSDSEIYEEKVTREVCYCFVTCKNMDVANAIKYCLNLNDFQ